VAALDDYISQVRRLLHDANGAFWTDAELTDDINQARNRIALDSGSIRSLFTFYLSASQESYPYSGAVASISIVAAGQDYTSAPTISFSGGGGSGVTATAAISSGTISSITITANGSGFTAAPTVSFSGGGGTSATATASIMSALDILGISVNRGNSWMSLGYTYFTEFQAKARYYRSVSGQPVMWSKGPSSSTGGGDYFYIFQIPAESYQSDIDAIVQPNPLVDDASTVEQLVYPYTDLVQYYAAYLAKNKQQEFSESANFLRIYDELMRRSTSSRYQRRVPNPYG
jgi:hypothetical protein